ncbi:DEKNAAC105105 [Brettanomyces naardenensis]|uniref:DEKNAAC105105 n=1 Tax=Brettanomyces naardenensis TaxID=13370 RepID=A0A448YSP3_BRENA|nr:DEKNAAC105105 [Brettanomyces naardenensis]
MSAIAKTIKVALLQFYAASDKTANLLKAQQLALKAIKKQPDLDLLVLPECFNSPYAVDQFHNYCEKIPEGETTHFLSTFAKEHKVAVIGGSFPELGDDGNVYNTSLTFDNTGKIVAKHRKVHLFDIDIPGKMTFKESATLHAGNKATVFDIDGLGRFGLAICYDIRFPELAMTASRKGAGTIVYPGAFNTVTGPRFWTKFGVARAIDNQTFVILCSPARNPNGGYQAYGHSMVVDPNGDVLVEAGHDEEIVYAELDPEIEKEARRNIPLSTQRRFDIYRDVSKDAVAGAL